MRKIVLIAIVLFTTIVFFACKKENTMRHKLNGAWNIVKFEKFYPKGVLYRSYENCGYFLLYDQGKGLGSTGDTNEATNDCINKFTIDSISSYSLTNKHCAGSCYWFATSNSRMYFWSGDGYSTPITLYWDVFKKSTNKYEWHHEGNNYEEVFTVVRTSY